MGEILVQTKPRLGVVSQVTHDALVARRTQQSSDLAGLVIVINSEISCATIRTTADVALAALGGLDGFVLDEGDSVLAPEIGVTRLVALTLRADSLRSLDLSGAPGTFLQDLGPFRIHIGTER